MFPPFPRLIDSACLICSTFQLATSHLYHISSVPCLICTVSYLYRVSSLPCLIFTMSYLFAYLICSISHIFHVLRFRLFPKLSDFVSSSSHVSESIMFDKSRNVSSKMYIERTAHPVFWKLLIRSDTQFNLFIDEIFA